ncbi:MAG: hypothetical protein A2V93_06115 [Ignavibacteria bacterium RBG_16_34_14]|nr:MAG: hypothetical protein A2V93_06115 [Ignavibacteria bacterium RBG_16_34_14]
MRGAIITKVSAEKEKKINLNGFLRTYLLKPFVGGILGFFGFFTLLIISKYLGLLIGNRATFQIDFTDLLLSLLGFAFIFVVKLKENTKGRML